VICLGCGDIGLRRDVQHWMEQHNPDHLDPSAPMAPDGDADLDAAFERSLEGFRVPTCRLCDSALKPHVVFFGESVPKARVDAAWSIVHGADVLLVVGSSLAVYSGYRFVRGTRERGQPLALVNLGESRGDAHASVRVAVRAGAVLPQLAAALRS
jgi:NAD-dependent SIR2 family protein deacetylase